MNQIDPIHVATVNGNTLRFFAPPSNKPALPWFALGDLYACFHVPGQAAKAAQAHMRREWKHDVRAVLTSKGIVTIAPNFVAQGYLGAMEELGQLKGALDDYCHACIPATHQLVGERKFGSTEWYEWMKEAIGTGSGAFQILDAAQRHGEVRKVDGENLVRIPTQSLSDESERTMHEILDGQVDPVTGKPYLRKTEEN
jgi:hypothetical protein